MKRISKFIVMGPKNPCYSDHETPTNGRDANGRFTKRNPYASRGGHARAQALDPDRRSEIARMGFDALVSTHFDGDADKAIQWLGKVGAWATDQGYARQGLGKFPHPGTPAEYMARQRER